MKIRGILFCNFMLFSMFLFFCSNKSIGQERVDISTGFGTTELLNLGLRFQFQQSQLGFSIGTLPVKDGGFSAASHYYYHFGGFSDLSNRRPWYGKSGLMYSKSKLETFTDSYLFLDIRIGRDFNLSKKIGIAIDAGPAIQLIHTTTDIEGGWSLPVFPSIGLAFFYRL